MTIILKTTSSTGWKSATALLDDGHAVLCPSCGAICHESAAGEHDAWHADLAHKSLPLLADFLTEMVEIAEIDEDPSPGPDRSAKVHIQLPKLTAADVEG